MDAVQRPQINVLFVDLGLGMGGGQLSLITLLRYLDREIIRPIVVIDARNEIFGASLEELGVRVYRIVPEAALSHVEVRLIWREATALMNVGRSASRAFRELSRLVWREDVHIVDGNTLAGAVVGGLVARLTGRKAVFHARMSRTRGFGHHGWVDHLAAVLAHRIVANSCFTARSYGIWKPKIEIVYPPIDFARLRRAPVSEVVSIRSRLGFGKRDRIVGFVGSIIPQKRVDVFLAAAKEIKASLKETKFLIVGAPAPSNRMYLDEMHTLAYELGIGEDVRFVGFQRQVDKLMSCMDVLVHTAMNEPFGRVVAEAAYLGVPIVAPYSGGIPEIIQDGVSGILVDGRVPSSFAAAVVSLLENPSRAQQIGARAAKEVRSKFSPRAVAEAHEVLFRELACF